jgi:aldehyde dehydrogenase (NAD+)
MGTFIDNNIEVQELFALQKNYAKTLRKTTAQDRIVKLKKLEQLVLKYQNQLVEAIYKDFDKPAAETVATEVLPTITEIRHTIKSLKAWLKPKNVSPTLPLLGTTAKVYVEPKGVTLIIAPWNYPFQLAMNPLVSAIAAGNCAIVKPSELTPHTSSLLAQLVKELATAEEIAVVEGGVEVATALLDLPFDHIFFTGSPAVGKIVMRAAAKHLTSVTLELGGKSPVVIDETADLQDTAQKLLWGKCVNAGQTCIAPDYVLVQESVKEPFLEALKKQLDIFYNPQQQGTEQSTSLARIVNTKHFQRIAGLIDDAVQRGATIVYGGKRNENSRFIEPTVLTDVNYDMVVMQDEIFGTVLPVLTYKKLDDALAAIDQLPKPLAMYIFSQSQKNIDYLIKHSTAGGTCVNDCLIHIAHPDLPFGGVNNSGIGKSHGYAGFLEFCNQRAVLQQRVGWTSIKLLYPPYTKKVDKLLKLMLDWL